MLNKLLLGTAIAMVLATASYAQNAISIPPETAKALQDGMIDDNIEDPGYPDDLLNGDGGQPALANPTTAQPRELSKEEYDPEEELVPGAPLPPGFNVAHVYMEECIWSDICYWFVVTELTAADGHIEWRFYNTKVPCNQARPTLVWLPPTLPFGDALRLNQALETNPGETDHLLNGEPETDGTPPALANPTPKAQQSESTKTDDKTSENSQSGAPNKSSETAPGTDQNSQPTERQSESKPNSNGEKANSKSTGDTEKSDAKSTGNSEHSNAKSTRTIERANAKTENSSEHATRTVAHEKPKVSHHVAHTTEAGHIGGVHEGGLREAGKHVGGLGGMHAGGLGGLGSVHPGGLGGLHLGGFGGMHIGGFGRL